MALLLFSCAKKSEIKFDPDAKFQPRFWFVKGDHFETYHYQSNTIIHPVTGIRDLRRSYGIRYEVLEARVDSGAMLKMHFHEILAVALERNNRVGSGKVIRGKGIVEWEGDPGMTKEQLTALTEGYTYLRVSTEGRVLAVGTTPPPSNPLSVTDWSKVEGYGPPPFEQVTVHQNLFGVIFPGTQIERYQRWEKKIGLPIRFGEARALFNVRFLLADVHGANLHITGRGTPQPEAEGAKLQITDGSYMSQSMYDLSRQFIKSHREEGELTYKLPDGKTVRERFEMRVRTSKVK